MSKAILFDAVFLLTVAFFMHLPWTDYAVAISDGQSHYGFFFPIQNVMFLPSFVLVFIALYEDMKKWAKQRKRKRDLEKYRI